MAQCPEPAQDGGCKPARQGAVAVGEGRQARMRALTGEQFVERNSPPENAIEDIGGNSSSGEAGDFRLWGSALTRHTRIVAAKLCRGRETLGKYVSNAQLWVLPAVTPTLESMKAQATIK